MASVQLGHIGDRLTSVAVSRIFISSSSCRLTKIYVKFLKKLFKKKIHPSDRDSELEEEVQLLMQHVFENKNKAPLVHLITLSFEFYFKCSSVITD